MKMYSSPNLEFQKFYHHYKGQTYCFIIDRRQPFQKDSSLEEMGCFLKETADIAHDMISVVNNEDNFYPIPDIKIALYKFPPEDILYRGIAFSISNNPPKDDYQPMPLNVKIAPIA